jgi:hypothetical protein
MYFAGRLPKFNDVNENQVDVFSDVDPTELQGIEGGFKNACDPSIVHADALVRQFDVNGPHMLELD